MPFKVTDAHRLQIEADRVQSILEMKHISEVPEWDEAEFVTFLVDKTGLEYTGPELVAIRDELLVRGVIETV